MFKNSYFVECFNTQKTKEQRDEEYQAHQRHKKEISSLPRQLHWHQQCFLHLYQGFWISDHFLLGVLSLPHHLRPIPSDIFFASFPKSGTTWLKAIIFAICTRNPEALLTRHPHQCSPTLEIFFSGIHTPDLDVLESPRQLSTHIPYSLLPKSLQDSPCRIIYVCREPKDTFVSTYHFFKGMCRSDASLQPISLSEAFDLFCNGMSPYGPVWEHQLEYWRESQRRPEKVLFVKYEDMKMDPEAIIKRMAEFIGKPFSTEEEMSGMVAQIVRLTSFEKLSELEVNRTGLLDEAYAPVEKSSFFRKGKVGDWKEHLTMAMAERLDAITRDKLHQSGLTHLHDQH